MHFSIDRTVHTTAFDKPVVDHWLERKIAQTAAGSTEKDRSDDRPMSMKERQKYQCLTKGHWLWRTDDCTGTDCTSAGTIIHWAPQVDSLVYFTSLNN